jgi:Tc5 transposase DNA-binding domain/helix-turn-helix, Psq domain
MAPIRGTSSPKAATKQSKAESRLLLESRKKLAIKFLEQVRLSGKKPSIRAAARKFGVPHTSLSDRSRGKKTRVEARHAQQSLSPQTECVLVEWIRHWGGRGVPMTSGAVRAKAMALAGKDVGIGWTYPFRKRHPELKSVWSSTLDAARAKQVNATVVHHFYDLLMEELVGKHIPEENIYNMDEKGIVCGQHERVKVWVDKKQNNTMIIGDNARELTTIMECVCADGSSVSPMIIFKGVRQSKEWCVQEDNGLNAM